MRLTVTWVISTSEQVLARWGDGGEAGHDGVGAAGKQLTACRRRRRGWRVCPGWSRFGQDDGGIGGEDGEGVVGGVPLQAYIERRRPGLFLSLAAARRRQAARRGGAFRRCRRGRYGELQAGLGEELAAAGGGGSEDGSHWDDGNATATATADSLREWRNDKSQARPAGRRLQEGAFIGAGSNCRSP